ncbi:NAD(P)-binding domain-containing protein, partial [Streptomyces sp. SID8382]
MRIGVLGTGRMADALGTQWARAGHDLFIGGRSRPKAQALAARIGHGARAGSLREAAGFGEVALLAVAYEGVEAALEAAGAAEGTL